MVRNYSSNIIGFPPMKCQHSHFDTSKEAGDERLECWENSDLRIGAQESFPDVSSATSELWATQHHETKLERMNACVVTVSDSEMVILGGIDNAGLLFVDLFNVETGQWTKLPNLKLAKARREFGAVCINRVLYLVGGCDVLNRDHEDNRLGETEETLHIDVLDLEKVSDRWVRVASSPLTKPGYIRCAGDARSRLCVSLESDIYIRGCLDCGDGLNSYTDILIFNTTTRMWRKKRLTRVGFAHIHPGRNTLIWGDGYIIDVKEDLIASLPPFPKQANLSVGTGSEWNCGEDQRMTVLRNRFVILVACAGGNQMVAFDWKEKRWFQLPKMKEVRTGCWPAVVGNRLVITAGWKGESLGYLFSTMSWEIGLGIGIEKEKLLLSYFHGKARKEKEEHHACPFNKLDSRLFAHVLRYLITPFASEVNRRGSIFGTKKLSCCDDVARLLSSQNVVPPKLRISILHEGEEFIVIHKPCNLRSVPGNASHGSTKNISTEFGPEHDELQRKRKRYEAPVKEIETSCVNQNSYQGRQARKTAQEAWSLALKSFSNDQVLTAALSLKEPSAESLNLIQRYLAGLAVSSHDSIPRKFSLFEKYLRRNSKRLVGNVKVCVDHADLAEVIYDQIKQRMEGYIRLPETTRPEESALGQLEIVTGIKDRANAGVYVVHRLDCETSGVMVFAKSPKAASFLCQAWRKNSSIASNGLTAPEVEKVYLAVVREWPPFQRNRKMSGIIDLPVEPCRTERLKWQVADVASATAKSSQTKWSVISSNYLLPSWCESIYLSQEERQTTSGQESTMRAKMTGIVLELRPVTGRTHQLRVHCAHVGSGIVGDSLYGKDRLCDKHTYDPNDPTRNNENGPHLMLHAAVLTFPRPPTNDDISSSTTLSCTVTDWPSWYDPYS